MPTPTKLLLFDLDGTLMLSGGAGSRALDRVFHRRFGVENAFNGIQPHGQTDPVILRMMFANNGLRFDDEAEAIRAVAAEYRDELAIEMPKSQAAVMMPGVGELLEALQSSGALMGLLTGNFEFTARIKLDRFDLNRYFPFGAYATDSDNRSDLPPIAVRRAERHAGRAIGLGPHVTIIGDTPNDVRAACDNGCTALGVATTKYSPDELREAGAHRVFADLSDTHAVLRYLEV